MIANLIITGRKCGTSGLALSLANHPDFAGAVPKEPLYFEQEYGDIKGYEKYFQGINEKKKWIFDARSRLLSTPLVTRRIAQTIPDAKIIVLVRNPIERAFSSWKSNYNIRTKWNRAPIP